MIDTHMMRLFRLLVAIFFLNFVLLFLLAFWCDKSVTAL
jgi:hypothetical protein